MALIDGLIAWWELDNTDDSHTDNNYDLTNVNATFATGKINNGASFVRAAANQSLSITDTNGPLLSPANTSYTMAGWFKLASDPGGTQFISCKLTGSNGEFWLGYQGGVPSTKFSAFGSAGGGNEISAERSGALTPGNWYFFVAWFDADDDKVHLQVSADSAYEGTVNDSSGTLVGGIFETTGDFVIGADTAGFFGGRWFDGVIDQFGVWGRALGESERQQLYNSGSGLSYAQLSGAVAPTLSWLPSTRVVRGASAIIIPSGFDPGQTVS